MAVLGSEPVEIHGYFIVSDDPNETVLDFVDFDKSAYTNTMYIVSDGAGGWVPGFP